MIKIMIWIAEFADTVFLMLCGYCIAKGNGVAALLSVFSALIACILKDIFEEYLQNKQNSLN